MATPPCSPRALTLALFAGLAGGPASASCAVADRLAGLHTAYDDLIEGYGTPRAEIGRFVIERELGQGADLDERLRDGGFFDLMGILGPLLSDMGALARSGGPPGDLSRHRENRDAFETTIRSTGCFDPPGQDGEADQTSDEEGDESEADDAANEGAFDRAGSFFKETAPFSYLAGVLLLAAIGGLIFFLRRRAARSNARTFMRHSLRAEFTLINSNGRQRRVEAVNISRGGIMIKRPKDMENGEIDSADVNLGIGNAPVVHRWENSLYVGLEFRTPLEESVFDSILAAAKDATDGSAGAPTEDAIDPPESTTAPA